MFFFKQKTAYEMRISDWSSDVCSSDLGGRRTNAERTVITAIDDAGRDVQCALEFAQRAGDFIVQTTAGATIENLGPVIGQIAAARLPQLAAGDRIGGAGIQMAVDRKSVV